MPATIQERIAERAAEDALAQVRSMTEIESVHVERCAEELEGRWSVTVDVRVAGGGHLRYSGWADRREVTLDSVDLWADPFAGVNLR